MQLRRTIELLSYIETQIQSLYTQTIFNHSLIEYRVIISGLPSQLKERCIFCRWKLEVCQDELGFAWKFLAGKLWATNLCNKTSYFQLILSLLSIMTSLCNRFNWRQRIRKSLKVDCQRAKELLLLLPSESLFPPPVFLLLQTNLDWAVVQTSFDYPKFIQKMRFIEVHLALERFQKLKQPQIH